MKRFIVLVPIGLIDRALLEHLQSALSKKFSFHVSIEKEGTLPPIAYDRKRGQYKAEYILSFLRDSFSTEDANIVAVLADDVYAKGYHYIFGQADVNGKCALFSLTRLHPVFYGQEENETLFIERALKEAVHEIGHLFGCGHCQDASCVMFFSRNIHDTDHKSASFCPNHAEWMSS